MVSPAFTFTGASGSLARFDAPASTTVTATLDDLTGINSVAWSVVGTDETGGTYTLTTSGTLGSVASFTSGAAGTCGILQCTVNGGVNPATGDVDETMTATAKWSVPTAGGLHVVAAGEDMEHNSTYGWTGPVNAGIRAASLASGSFSDATFNVYDNVDNTKVWKVQVSGVTTGTTRTHTVPNANGTFALLSLAQSWSSDQTFGTSGGKLLVAGSSSGSTELKASATASGVATLQAGTGTLAFLSDITTAFSDATWTIYNSGDNTRIGALDLGSVTSGNTRTLIWPDANGRISLYDVAESVTGTKTFGDGALKLSGSSSGAITIKAPAAASTYIATFPAATGTVSFIGLAETFSAAKTFADSTLLLAGSSSGTTTLKATAAASGTITLPAATGTASLIESNESISGQKTFADGTLILAGSSSGTTTLAATAAASGTVTLPAATDTLVGKATTDTLTNKTYDTAGTGNVFRINGTGISAVTGSGSVVLATSPTLTTPTIGVATATSINKVAITAPATSATLTIADGTTFNVNTTGLAAGQYLQYNGTSWVGITGPTISSVPHVKGTDSSASAATAEAIFWRAPGAGTIKSVYFEPRGNATADASNYASMIVRHYNSSAVLQTTWTATTQSTSQANNTPWAIATALSVAMSAGDYFTLQITKAGTGVTVAAGNTQVDFIPTS